MKLLIISDIHGNLDALNAILEKAKGIGYDKLICLGDLVGYGPTPNEIVEWAIDESEKGSIFLKGNHDKDIAGDGDLSWYNPNAAEAITIHRKLVTPQNKEFLKSLPYQLKDDGLNLHFVHGAPRIWDEYILDSFDAKINFPHVFGELCFVGHTHIPIVWKDNDQPKIVNVGSVGQPRDGDPRACFVIYETQNQKIDFHRVEYDIRCVQGKMKKIKMPSYLINRLEKGE